MSWVRGAALLRSLEGRHRLRYTLRNVYPPISRVLRYPANPGCARRVLTDITTSAPPGAAAPGFLPCGVRPPRLAWKE